MDALTQVLSRLVVDGVTTETLCERLAPLLRIFLKALEIDNIKEG
jgi:hypothetical protein